MYMDNKDKILDKLRKLISLRESAKNINSEGEANAAAAAISRLLMEYNLCEDDIPTEEKINNPVIEAKIPYKPEFCKVGVWYKNLVIVVCEFNNCRPMIFSTSNQNSGRMQRNSFLLVGRKINVETSIYLISLLANKAYQIGLREYKKYIDCYISRYVQPDNKSEYLRNFLMGFVLGLNRKLKNESLREDKKENSLILNLNNEIDYYLKDKIIEENNTSYTPSFNIDILNKGFKEGLVVVIEEGITNNTKTKNLL